MFSLKRDPLFERRAFCLPPIPLKHDRSFGAADDLLVGNTRLFLGKRMCLVLQVMQMAVVELHYFSTTSA